MEWKETMVKSFSRMDKDVTEWSSLASSSNCRCELQTSQCNAVGSTAVVVVVSEDEIVVSNCGDSRVVLCRNDVALSTDHKELNYGWVLGQRLGGSQLWLAAVNGGGGVGIDDVMLFTNKSPLPIFHHTPLRVDPLKKPISIKPKSPSPSWWRDSWVLSNSDLHERGMVAWVLMMPWSSAAHHNRGLRKLSKQDNQNQSSSLKYVFDYGHIQ
ncbi:phosphatase 2C 37-like protein [Tanacetum coccineum]